MINFDLATCDKLIVGRWYRGYKVCSSSATKTGINAQYAGEGIFKDLNSMPVDMTRYDYLRVEAKHDEP
jgi:hypothetical protein